MTTKGRVAEQEGGAARPGTQCRALPAATGNVSLDLAAEASRVPLVG